MQILKVENLHKTYGEESSRTKVVDGLTFSLKAGECYGLLGPNGAGKTTTIKLCLGLTVPDSGSITLANYPIPQQARMARMRVGVVPQGDNLDPDFTVEENLIVYSRYFGITRAQIEARLTWLLDFSRLDSKRKAKISELSGGMKRRLTLARALVNNPDIIFMDEPTTGLDPQARHLIWEGLKSLLAQGKTIFLTTHFMDEAERLCDRIAVLDHGKLIAEGTPRKLIADHIEPQVIEVYGDQAGNWAKQASSLARRVETSGETIFCYTEHADSILQSLANESGLRYLHRPANLEDVFLKLTGREMRD